MFMPFMGFLMGCGIFAFLGCLLLAFDPTTSLTPEHLLLFVIGAHVGFGSVAIFSALLPELLPIGLVRVLASVLPFVGGRGLVWLLREKASGPGRF